MKLSSYLTFALLLWVVFFGCDNDGDSLERCMPQGAKPDGDSIAYIYNSEHRLTEIQSRSKTTVHKRYAIDYLNNKPVKVTVINRNYLGSETEDESYQLFYGTNDLPKSMIYSQRYFQGMEKIDSIIFSHDDKNRLIKKDDWLIYANFTSLKSHTRYEYLSDNNVSKIFYKLYGGTGFYYEEVLGAEHLSFDNHQRFFAGSDDLKMLEIYVFKYEPSANNVLTLKLFASDPYTRFSNGAFENVQFRLSYDDKGRVNSLLSNSIYLSAFTFNKMTYICH